MKRIQLFEFEDFSWFPTWIRTSMTNLLAVLHKMMGTKMVLANIIKNVKTKYDFNQIVDMGSGSGGIMPDVVIEINKDASSPMSLLLTDLYPNPKFIEYINNKKQEYVNYNSASLDATNLATAPKGLKTMVNSFHHMSPDKAKGILKSAQDHKQPILIYEIAENKMPLLVWWLLLPISLVILFIMTWFMTPFCKPLSLRQIIFTYLIPIIPICYAWDGQASMPRMYTFEDIKDLLKDIQDKQYQWTMNVAKKENGKTLGYYVLGLPR